ncbi:MAG: hypothetical protein WAW90_00570 [Minisyncoccia bacterium]
MTDQPLRAFSPPTVLLSYLPSSISTGTVVLWALSAIFIIWSIYTFIAIYHWIKYSHASWIAFPATALHLFISFSIISYALFGAFTL